MDNLGNVESVRRVLRRAVTVLPALLVITLVMSGCSLLFGGGPEEEPVAEEQVDRSVVPTFTPTPDMPPTPVPATEEADASLVQVPVTDDSGEGAPEAPVAEEGEGEAAPVVDEPVEEPTPTPAPPTPTPSPKLTVNIQAANVRNGPGTNYGIAGAVDQGQSFDIVGKNPEGTWWQFCCVNGQQVWIFGELVTTENAETVAVAENIPAPPEPVAVAPAPEQPAPEQPAEEQPPAEEPQPAPQAANAGACGGDDGCKFRIRTGPVKMQNSGFELKIQAAFIHSGVDGGQMQGDYRIGIEKDGQLIATFGDTRSIALTSNDGPAGKYNYEAKVNVDQLPGGSLAGNYFFWVLDGNRERDSEVFRLDLGGNEGEIYVEFDQG